MGLMNAGTSTSGIAGGTLSFATIQPPAGTSPAADSPSDVLNLTSSDSSIVITGNSSTDTLDFKVKTFTAGSVIFANGTGVISEDNDNIFFDDTNNYFGVGTNTPSAVGHFVGVNPVNPPTGVSVSIVPVYNSPAYTLSSSLEGVWDWRLYGYNGTLFSPTYASTYVSLEDFFPGIYSVTLSFDSSNGPTLTGSHNYNFRVRPIWTDAFLTDYYGDATSAPFLKIVTLNVGLVQTTINSGSGPYAAFDTVEYEVTPLYYDPYLDVYVVGEPIYASLTDTGGNPFTVDVFWENSTDSPSSYRVKRSVNGGGYNEEQLIGFTAFTDDGTGWGGTNSYGTAYYSMLVEFFPATNTGPGKMQYEKEVDNGGYTQYFLQTNAPENTGVWDYGTNWTVSTPPESPVMNLVFNLSFSGGTGSTSTRILVSNDTLGSYVYYYDASGSPLSDDGSFWVSGNAVTPNAVTSLISENYSYFYNAAFFQNSSGSYNCSYKASNAIHLDAPGNFTAISAGFGGGEVECSICFNPTGGASHNAINHNFGSDVTGAGGGHVVTFGAGNAYFSSSAGASTADAKVKIDQAGGVPALLVVNNSGLAAAVFEGPSDGGYATYGPLVTRNTSQQVLCILGGSGSAPDYGLVTFAGYGGLGGILGDFQWTSQTASGDKRAAVMRCLNDSTYDGGGHIVFEMSDRVNVASNQVFNVNWDWKVGVNTTTPGAGLHVTGKSASIPTVLVKAYQTPSVPVVKVTDYSDATIGSLTADGVLFANGHQINVTTVSGAYGVAPSDGFIAANAVSAGFTVTLPTAIGIEGRIFTIKKVDATGNGVTVATTSSQTIDGATTQVITTQYTSMTVISDGVNWSII